MNKIKVAKQLVKIAKELVSVKVFLDFSTEEKVFEKYKKQHKDFDCKWKESGVETYWEISSNGQTKKIFLDKKTSNSPQMEFDYNLQGKQYDSLEKALENIKFKNNIDWDNIDTYYWQFRKLGTKKIMEFFLTISDEYIDIGQYFEKYSSEYLYKEIEDCIKQDKNEFIRVVKIKKPDEKYVDQIYQGINVDKNISYLIDKYNKGDYKSRDNYYFVNVYSGPPHRDSLRWADGFPYIYKTFKEALLAEGDSKIDTLLHSFVYNVFYEDFKKEMKNFYYKNI